MEKDWSSQRTTFTGQDLIDLGMTPGPEMGAMLEALNDARREGEVSDREAAQEWVRQRLEQNDSTSGEA